MSIGVSIHSILTRRKSKQMWNKEMWNWCDLLHGLDVMDVVWRMNNILLSRHKCSACKLVKPYNDITVFILHVMPLFFVVVMMTIVGPQYPWLLWLHGYCSQYGMWWNSYTQLRVPRLSYTCIHYTHDLSKKELR